MVTTCFHSALYACIGGRTVCCSAVSLVFSRPDAGKLNASSLGENQRSTRSTIRYLRERRESASRENGNSLMLIRNKEPRPDVRACKRSLPGARFLEDCRGKQGAARGDLSGSVGPSLLKPPGDGFHKHRGHEVWHQLIGESVDGASRGNRSVRKVSLPALFDQVRKTRTHLPHKPGAALAAEQRPVEPVVLGDMLEELHPDLGRMFSPQLSDLAQQGAHGFLKDLLHQVVLILVVAIEGGPAHQRARGQFADGERLETPLLDQR